MSMSDRNEYGFPVESAVDPQAPLTCGPGSDHLPTADLQEEEPDTWRDEIRHHPAHPGRRDVEALRIEGGAMGPFARAVTAAIEHGSDCWAFEYFCDGGQWPEGRQRIYVDSRCAAIGPEWREFLRLTQAMENGWTPLARMRRERAQ